MKKRNKIMGTPVRPRLSIFKSAKHIRAQIIDDTQGKTLASASTLEKEVRADLTKGLGNQTAAKQVGQAIAKRAVTAGITQVVFDRGTARYHGALKVLADAAREGGLQF